MKRYVGRRTDGRCTVTVHEGSSERPLALRLDLWNHSPDGFEWGYGGSGPAQLALALAADLLGDDERAVRVHQPLKRKVVAKLPREAFELPEDQLRSALAEVDAD